MRLAGARRSFFWGKKFGKSGQRLFALFRRGLELTETGPAQVEHRAIRANPGGEGVWEASIFQKCRFQDCCAVVSDILAKFRHVGRVSSFGSSPRVDWRT